MRNQLAIVAALRKKMFRMSLLEVSASNLIARDLRRNGEHRNPAAMAIVKTVDQVQISGTAAARTHRQSSRQMSFRTRRECCRLLMPHIHPIHPPGPPTPPANAPNPV